MAKIRLFSPLYAGLSFGPDVESAINFGARGANEPHYALVDEDHPLLAALLEAEPEVQIVRSSGPASVYPCPFAAQCGHAPFKTEAGILEHLTEVHGIGGESTAIGPGTPAAAVRAESVAPGAPVVPEAPQTPVPAATEPSAPAPKPASRPTARRPRASRRRAAK